MKGILLTGGLGTRLYPLTRVINKHLLPLYDRPMFYWSLQTLIDSGIREIAIVSGPPTGEQIKKALEFFPRSSVNLSFIEQKEPRGMPDAIYSCKKFVGNSPFIMSVGDNLFGKNFKLEVKQFKRGAAAFVRKVKDPSMFGVAVFDKNNKVKSIVEKPKEFISSWAVGAPYMFDNSALKKIKSLKPSKRGELEIVDLLKRYIEEGSLRLLKRRDIWLDAGTPDSLLKANIIAKKLSAKNPL